MKLRPIHLLRAIYYTLKSRAFIAMARNLVTYGIIGASVYTFLTTNILLVAAALFCIYVARGGWEFCDQVYHTFFRDVRGLSCLLRFKLLQRNNLKRNATIPTIFESLVKTHPHKIALQWENVRWSFHDLNEYSNAIANHFKKQGVGHGDVVSVFVENRPEFVAIWLGLSKIGAISALINYNLRGDALSHCINISLCKAAIFSGNLAPAVKHIENQLKGSLKYYVVCDSGDSPKPENTESIDPVLNSGSRLNPGRPTEASYMDKLMYIYTSGTTGLPKAAVITHCRYYFMSTMPNLLLQYKSSDSIYCSLPLYHSNGGIVGLGQCLCHGITFSFRTKFSASSFWLDCKKFDSTVILYIGEICRYLLAQPGKITDKDHKVRMASGNGLRPEIWSHFVERFNISKVGEFYGATEGNANLMNITNTLGSCGFLSVMAPWAYPVTLLKINEDKELIRGSDGLCIRCKPGEFGMLVGKIISTSHTQRYDGYADKSASAKKIAFDVLRKGDSVFMSGDVLTMDKYGNMYFKDRTGDTFRWKGENVSTAECEAELSKALHNQYTVAVYGVELPDIEGRAGMAAIMDPNREVDLKMFYKGAVENLATYARPLFLRITDHLEVTGTHKIKKVALRNEGYDLNLITDPLYFLDASKGKYISLDKGLYDQIKEGHIRV